MPQRIANPDAIYKSEIDGHLLFVYRLNVEKEARVVFRQNGGRPLQLISYTKVPLGNTEEQRENKKI